MSQSATIASRVASVPATEPSLDFAALMARAKAGDTAAVEELVRQYEPEVRIVARVLLGPALRPHLDSIDLVQSVHRSLLVGLRQNKLEIGGPAQLIGLVLTMLRRKVARKWRHMRRQQRLSHGPTGAAELAGLLVSVGSGETDPARAAELKDSVQQLCSGLADVDRRLIEMRMEGHTTAEAARAMDMDRQVLGVRLQRLRKKLVDAGLDSDWL
jgi:RNA polymerase sigma factor (sigma-70 family)